MRFIFSILLLSFLAFPTLADTPVAENNREDIARLEQYLNSFKSMTSEFMQSSSNGNVADGTVYLARPNHMRFEYKTEKPLQMIADGKNLVFYDAQLQQVSYLSIKSSPLYPVLKEKVDLNDPSIALVRFNKKQGEISITFVRKDDPGSGEVTLQFSSNPLELRRWVIRDAQDIVTTVSLINPQFEVSIDPKLFVFNDPRPYQGSN